VSEDIELLRLRAKAKAKAARERATQQEQSPQEPGAFGGMTGLSPRDVGGYQEPIKDEEKAFYGGAFEGVPKTVTAAAQAGYDVLTSEDKSLGDFSESYKQHRDEWNEQLNELEEKHPGAFTMGDIAGGMMLSAPVSAPAQMGKGIAGIAKAAAFNFGVSGVSGMARDDENSLKEGLFSGLVGTAVPLIPVTVAGGAQWVKDAAESMASSRAGQFINGLSGRAVKEVNTHLRKFYGLDTKVKKVSDAAKVFGKELVDEGIFDKFDDVEAVRARVMNKRMALGDEYGKMLDMISDRTAQTGNINTKLLRDDLLKLAKKKLDTGPQGRKAFEKIREELDFLVDQGDMVKVGDQMITPEVTKDWDLKRLWKWTRDIADELDYKPESGSFKEVTRASRRANNVMKELLGEVEGLIDSKARMAFGEADKAAKSSYELMKKRYANLSVAERLMTDNIDAKGTDSIMNAVRMAVNIRRGAFALGVGGVLANPAVGASLLAVDVLAHHPKSASTTIKGLDTLSKFIKANPDSEITRRLGRAVLLASGNDSFMGDAHAADEYLDDEIGMAMAQAQLGTNPLDRTNESLIDNANAISTLLREYSPEAAKSFNKAMETQDDVELEKIGAMLAGIPEAQQFIKPGQGWNGKFHTEEEKRAAEDGLDLEQDISYSQKLKLKAKIRATGEIPMKRPEPDPFMQWISNRGEEPKI
jgi:hypothetical protein